MRITSETEMRVPERNQTLSRGPPRSRILAQLFQNEISVANPTEYRLFPRVQHVERRAQLVFVVRVL